MKFVSVFVFALAVSAQMRDNQEKRMSCDGDRNENRARSCKITENTIPPVGPLTIDAGRNGGVTVKGWNRRETLVRTKIEAWAPTDSEASLIAGQVHGDVAGGQIHASGPESRNNSGWSVSYEVFVPHATDLTLRANNGGIHLSDVQGRLEFNTVNGGVHLTRIAGNVNGSTQNGGVHVELEGARWEGGELRVRTQNGGVHLAMPGNYSAHIQTETVNGGIHSDFPTNITGERRPRSLDFNVGSGGPLIRVSTTNGGVHLSRT